MIPSLLILLSIASFASSESVSRYDVEDSFNIFIDKFYEEQIQIVYNRQHKALAQMKMVVMYQCLMQ